MMSNMGLNKLMEEAGEVVQEAAKICSMIEHHAVSDGSAIVRARIQSVLTWQHFDGHDMKAALEDELGDLRAAMRFVQRKLHLDLDRIARRSELKLDQFEIWDRLPK